MTPEELLALCRELIAHLDYCGWGRDAWEREASEDLRRRVNERGALLRPDTTKEG